MWCIGELVDLPSLCLIRHKFLCLQEKALQLPKEHEMDPKDKYTVFSATSRGYRKGIHKVPKWTRVSLFSSIAHSILKPSFVSSH